MEKRYEGFLANNGLYVLDTFTGEVKFISGDAAELSHTEPLIQNSCLVDLSNKSAINHEYRIFEQEVISSYPYLIARPFHDLLNEVDPRMKCKLMVDTFTAILKYMALQLASEYIKAPELKDIQIHQTLTKDLSRPLISAWNLLIARSLPVFKDHNLALFSPEIKVAYEKLESKCKEPYLISQTYSDENGEIKSRIKKLGKIQALINYRNGLAHGFNQSKDRAQKEFNDYYPLLTDILQEVNYMSKYTLWHVESNESGINGIRLMGSTPSSKKVDFEREGINPAISPLFIINDNTGDILPLYAFFDIDQTNEVGLPEIGKDIFVFEGNTKNTVIYLSSSGEHLEKTSRFLHWKDLLEQKQLDVEWVNDKNLSIDTLNTIGKYISSHGIQALISSGKYIKEATIERDDLNELLNSFSDSVFNGFILGGESGIGKSTLLAQKTEIWQNEGHMVAFYRGSALNQSDVANKFLRDCALKLNYIEDFLGVTDTLFTQANKNCYLIIDAINEYAGDINNLIKSVENIVIQASNFKWFKVIVSIRDSTYNRVQSKFGDMATEQYFKVEEERSGEKVLTNLIKLQPVEKVFTEQLYSAYRNYKWKESDTSDEEGIYKFRPSTEFKEIDPQGSTIELLRSPLMTRLILQSFHRTKLPSNLKNDQAIRLYLDNIVLEKNNENTGFPERLKLLKLLVKELDNLNSERIERDELVKSDIFKSYLLNNQKDSPYIQLLDLGVIMEEWEKDECYVRFAFDRFLEFMLAELHSTKIKSAQDLMKLSRRITQFKILQGTVETIILRFCTNKQSNILIELSDLADEESIEMQQLCVDIVTKILHTLSIEDTSLFEEIIQKFPDNPGDNDLKILVALLNKLYTTGDLDNFGFVMPIAQKEAIALKNTTAQTDLLLYHSEIDIMQGRYEMARNKIQLVIKTKEEINDLSGLCKSLLVLAELEKLEKRIADSLSILEKAYPLIEKSNSPALKAKALNMIANIKRSRNQYDEAIVLYDQSYEISVSINDKIGLAKILNNKAIIFKNRGELESANDMYKEAFDILNQLGEKRKISAVIFNWAGVKKDQNLIKEAEKLYNEAIIILRNFNDKDALARALNAIGLLKFNKGELKKAKTLLNESLNLKIDLKNPPGLILDSIHRVFTILEISEKETYFKLANSFDSDKFNLVHKSKMANIELIMYINSKDSIIEEELNNKIANAKSAFAQTTLNDLDNKPVEALYFAAEKLIELGNLSKANKIAKDALTMIGTQNSIRKKRLLEISTFQ